MDDFDYKQRPIVLTYLATRPDGGVDTVIDGQLVYSSPRTLRDVAGSREPLGRGMELEAQGVPVEYRFMPAPVELEHAPDLVQRRKQQLNQALFCVHDVLRSDGCVLCDALDRELLRRRGCSVDELEASLLSIPGIEVVHVATDPERPGLLAVAYLGSVGERDVNAWMRLLMSQSQRTLDVRCYGDLGSAA